MDTKKVNLKEMEHFWNKILNYTLDSMALMTIYLGWITGTNIALFLGMCASVMAFINHYSQWRRSKKK